MDNGLGITDYHSELKYKRSHARTSKVNRNLEFIQSKRTGHWAVVVHWVGRG